MENAGINLRITSDPANIAWLSGSDGWSFYIHQRVLLGGDADLMIQAVDNFISNAIRYARSGISVRITAVLSDGTAVLRIGDEALGLTEEDLSRVLGEFPTL